MSAAAEFLASALADARQDGSECEPSALLKVAEQADPIAAISTHDGGNELFAALTNEFGFISASQFPNAQLGAEMREKLAGLFRWAIRSLHEWTRASDPNNQKLVAIFVISRYCRNAGPLWSELPDTAANDELEKELAAMLVRTRINISPDSLTRNPISQREAIDDFNKADSDGNWTRLADQLRSFAYFPDTFIPETVGYLHRFDRAMLLSAISGIHQTLMLLRVFEAFTPTQSCQLSLDTDNAHLDFCVVYRCLVPERWTREPIAAPPLLADVLRKIAKDESRWMQCMNAFNRYPMRYPILASLMGQVLADAPEMAVKAYVKSINLSALPSAGRQIVAEALSVFRSLGSEERRKFLWREAFARWQEWSFGAPEMNNLAAGIGQSELDFAVVGFAVECMSQRQREAFVQDICGKLSVLELKWHKSLSHFLTDKNLLLSSFQPIGHALQVGGSGEWLASATYLPFDKAKERYAALILKI